LLQKRRSNAYFYLCLSLDQIFRVKIPKIALFALLKWMQNRAFCSFARQSFFHAENGFSLFLIKIRMTAFEAGGSLC